MSSCSPPFPLAALRFSFLVSVLTSPAVPVLAQVPVDIGSIELDSTGRSESDFYQFAVDQGFLTIELLSQSLRRMDETIDYIGERYPDLTDGDLGDLREIGIRFCKPAIAHGSANAARGDKPAVAAEETEMEPEMEPEMEDASVA